MSRAPSTIPSLLPLDENLSAYLRQIHALPMLEEEEEMRAAQKWVSEQDEASRQKLILAHLRLVTKIAAGYRGYGLPYADLIAEGNIGLLMALRKYNPALGNRFSTYARWWIQAAIQEYILRSWSLVKIGTTAAQKKLFFNLGRLKRQLGTHLDTQLAPETAQEIANLLAVTPQEVEEMNQRLRTKEFSLNAPIGGSGDDSDTEWMDWMPDEGENHESLLMDQDETSKRTLLLQQALSSLTSRELEVMKGRRLHEPPYTLEEMSQKLHISRERVRQIEAKAFTKLQEFIKKLSVKNLETPTLLSNVGT